MSRGGFMADKNKKSKYDVEYAKANLKRIPLDVTKEKYQEIENLYAQSAVLMDASSARILYEKNKAIKL